jgi:hypothetical protein
MFTRPKSCLLWWTSLVKSFLVVKRAIHFQIFLNTISRLSARWTQKPLYLDYKNNLKFQEHFEWPFLFVKVGSFTCVQLCASCTSRYWFLTNHTLLLPPRGVFTRCLARWNFVLEPHFWELLICMSLLWGKIMLTVDGTPIMALFSAHTKSRKRLVLVHFMKAPEPSVFVI